MLANTVINPPNTTVVTKTTTSVELTIKLRFGASLLSTAKLKAKAIAPLIIPLNHINITYFKLKFYLNLLQRPTSNAGMNIPAPLAIAPEIINAKTKPPLNYDSLIP